PNPKSLEDYGFGKGYAHLVQVFRAFLRRCTTVRDQGRHIILIAHEMHTHVPNPRGEDFKGVHRSPGRGQDYGVGQGRGRGSGRHKHQDGDGDRHQDKGRGRENAETKALPLRERYYDREICNLCVTECPIGCHAIEMLETTRADGSVSYIPQVNEGCTGCGVCVMVCPTENPSIVVEPPEGGAHA
ncbi:MAG: 4Fe-4S dicluster domain-containing protein, partial [Bacteroidota bacterium]